MTGPWKTLVNSRLLVNGSSGELRTICFSCLLSSGDNLRGTWWGFLFEVKEGVMEVLDGKIAPTRKPLYNDFLATSGLVLPSGLDFFF
jgi:hypothetical protein